MIMKQKLMYVAPSIEVIKMENEGVIAASGYGTPDSIGNGGQLFKSSAGTRSGGGYASSSDLEDLINDILTVED